MLRLRNWRRRGDDGVSLVIRAERLAFHGAIALQVIERDLPAFFRILGNQARGIPS